MSTKAALEALGLTNELCLWWQDLHRPGHFYLHGHSTGFIRALLCATKTFCPQAQGAHEELLFLLQLSKLIQRSPQ